MHNHQYKLEVIPTNRGYKVQVGCQELVFINTNEDKEKMVEAMHDFLFLSVNEITAKWCDTLITEAPTMPDQRREEGITTSLKPLCGNQRSDLMPNVRASTGVLEEIGSTGPAS